jgi:streptothricin hydrolase
LEQPLSPATALIVIDVQVNMFDPANPVWSAGLLLDRLRELLARARAARALVVLVRNCGGAGDPDVPGTPGWELHPFLQPAGQDLVLDKTTCDTFASTALGDELDARGVRRLVVAGLQSEYCVRETTLGAVARGLDVTLVADGHSTYDSADCLAGDTVARVNAELQDRVRLANADSVWFS